MLHTPEVPVLYNGAGEQNADSARDDGQYGKPPRPSVDGFHGCVEAHAPSPEQRAALCSGAAVGDLIDLPVRAVAAGRQNRCAVHRKQYSGAI